MHLLLLTDSFPNQNGAGISQTLYNLLDGWQHPCTVLLPLHEAAPVDCRLPVQQVRYADGPWQPLHNRLGKWVNPWLHRKRLAWLGINGLESVRWLLPAKQQALVLVSTTVPEKLMAAYWLQQQGFTVIPYFMDDWMAGSTLRWRGGNLQQTVQQLLQQAPAWLMISRQLHHTLLRRYQLAPKPCLVVHNPAPAVQLTDGRWQMAGEVDDDNDATRQLPTANYQLIYAGSIWPMHADALAAVARAVHRLQQQGHAGFQLQVYSSAAHWQQQQAALAGPGVQYMGWLPYAQLQPLLQQAWLLVCTASFEEAHQAYSNSSVQTKLTDYMAAGRPILFVGPDEAASGQFVDEYDIGFSLATTHAADIAERLLVISALPVQYRRKCANALREASTRFSQSTIQQKLYRFLAEYG